MPITVVFGSGNLCWLNNGYIKIFRTYIKTVNYMLLLRCSYAKSPCDTSRLSGYAVICVLVIDCYTRCSLWMGIWFLLPALDCFFACFNWYYLQAVAAIMAAPGSWIRCVDPTAATKLLCQYFTARFADPQREMTRNSFVVWSRKYI